MENRQILKVAGVTGIAVFAALVLRMLLPDPAETDRPPPEPQQVSSEVQLGEWRAAALETCRCRQAGGRENECAEPLFMATRRVVLQTYEQRNGQMDFPRKTCGPLEDRQRCLKFADGRKCITEGYFLAEPLDEEPVPPACTAEEAGIILAGNRELRGRLYDFGDRTPTNVETMMADRELSEAAAVGLREIAKDPQGSAAAVDTEDACG